jgi:hypothetical protein
MEGGRQRRRWLPEANWRAVAGIQMGKLMRPKESGFGHTDSDDVRVRYEVLTRKVHVGETPPVADAGPDQLGIPAGTVTLNGSASYSPDGNPLTYLWTQDAGPSVALPSPTSAITTFTATGNQSYSFRLVVKDNFGGQGQARTHVTTATASVPVIGNFSASPTSISAGQSSTLSWTVTNASTVTISAPVGNVPLSGTASVSPTTTTTYTLTATNANGSVNATATITVNTPQTTLIFLNVPPPPRSTP